MQIRASKSILLILLYLSYPISVAAETNPTRFSLAISGGASKGAYEAGLIWGMIEVLRQVQNAEHGSLGGEPRPIEIASIAGTSAGGINTLLAAMAWSVKPERDGGFANRIDDNIFRDVWLTPDVNRLLPIEPDSLQYLPDDAMLSRRDLVAVARELAEKWRRPGTFRAGLRLPIGVTVTRTIPDTLYVNGVAVSNQRFYIPFEMRTQADGSAAFFFDPHDYPALSDPAMIPMPWPSGDAPYTVSDQQVQDALMTTSAFPGGFGRKRLQYCRRTGLTIDTAKAEDSPEGIGSGKRAPVCPDGYALAEAEFADGGLFDNLPIGLARTLAESSALHKKIPLPVKYIYVDPNRERFQPHAAQEKRACDEDTPPEACRTLTFDLGSESVVLGGAIGTARKYELYRELTGDNWRLNLSQLARRMADTIDAEAKDVKCDADLPYFDGQPACSDRLRHAARLLELTHSYRMTPVFAPLSGQALLQAGIAATCRPTASPMQGGHDTECAIDAKGLRMHLATVLTDLSAKILPEEENLAKEIKRSALSTDSDRLMQVTSRGGPVTGTLLDDFGAFLDYKFREYDYTVGVYDAVTTITSGQCTQNFPAKDQQDQRLSCRDRLSEQLYRLIGVADNPRSRYVFAMMARQEFEGEGGLRYAYDPMPPEDRDMRIIFEGLALAYLDPGRGDLPTEALLSTEQAFFEHLKAEGFAPTPSPDGETALLTLIMDDPEYWAHELVNRATNRLVYLEQQADAIYRAREPDPEKRDQANPTLMGAGALTLRTATYKYPDFTFSPSTAPESWIWRNVIPYEASFDFMDGDVVFYWQPTWNFDRINAGLRLGLGFTGGLFNSNADEDRENYGVLGLDLTKIEKTALFSGWGITPAVYHNWTNPEDADQTTFGMDVHVNFIKNRVRVSLGARDIINDAENTVFLTIGIADLPGLFYWLGR
jgi:predicted acylesterase/phospholipase RssA